MDLATLSMVKDRGSGENTSGGSGGGGSTFIITLSGTEGNYTMDKTFDEILEAYQNGYILYVYDATNSTPPGDVPRIQPNIFPLVGTMVYNDGNIVGFIFAVTMVTQLYADEPLVVETVGAMVDSANYIDRVVFTTS